MRSTKKVIFKFGLSIILKELTQKESQVKNWKTEIINFSFSCFSSLDVYIIQLWAVFFFCTLVCSMFLFFEEPRRRVFKFQNTIFLDKLLISSSLNGSNFFFLEKENRKWLYFNTKDLFWELSLILKTRYHKWMGYFGVRTEF